MDNDELRDRVKNWIAEWGSVESASFSIGYNKATLHRWISGELEIPIIMKRLLDAEELLRKERISHAVTKKELRLRKGK